MKDEAIGILRDHWGHDAFRPLQWDIIESVLDGRDTLGLMPTGGGKSICFQVPALMRDGLTIVVTPLISLMKDQVDNLRGRGIRAYALHGGMSLSETRLAYDRCRLGKTRLLYVSPERLGVARFLDAAREWDVTMIVVDEAHCISQWGYDFRPSYLQISKLRSIFPEANVLALTASATPEVAADIKRQLGFRPGSRNFAMSFSRSNLSYVVRYDEAKESKLLNVLETTSGTAIVYVRSRKKAAMLAELLDKGGIPATFYHAGLEPHEKESRQNAWKEGRVRVMVATNAFGMGIDKPDVRTVVHYDIPSSLEEYYQEAGRAGRDGAPSYAVTIASKADKGVLTRRLSESFPEKDFICRVYELACVFCDIAVGAGRETIHDFNMGLFCRRFSLPAAPTYSALRILGRAGYLEYIEEVNSRARVMITATKSEFYHLNLDPTTDAVFTALQRKYTGLFADFVPIEETALSLWAEVPAEQVHESLLLLGRMKVIQYIPKRITPYLYLPGDREETRHILLPRAIYEERRAAMARRIEAMKRFVFSDDTCRSEILLSYFGEKATEPCGKCDVCRERSRGATPGETEEAVMAVLRALPDGAMASVTDIARVMGRNVQGVAAAVRSLADEGRLRLDGPTVTLAL